MDSCDRLKKCVKGESIDRCMVAPYAGNYGAALSSVPIGEYNTNGTVMADAQIKAHSLHDLDVVVAQSDNYYIAQAFGCGINQPSNETPNLIKTALNSLDEIDRLPKIDPKTDGRMPVYINAVRRLKEHFGDSVVIRSPGTGPFSLAGHAMGTENFLVELALADMNEDKNRIRKIMDLLEYTSDALILFLMEMIKSGADIVTCGDSSASLDLISPGMYERYVFPMEQKVFRAIKPLCREKGAYSLLHICGDTTAVLDLMAGTDADILEIDHKVDMARAAEIVGDRACLMGNLDPAAVLLQGTPGMVKAEALNVMNKVKGRSPFILGSGCEVAVKTPLENIKAMIAAAEEFGPWN